MVKLTAEELMEAKKGARDLDDVLMKRPKMFDDEPGQKKNPEEMKLDRAKMKSDLKLPDNLFAKLDKLNKKKEEEKKQAAKPAAPPKAAPKPAPKLGGMFGGGGGGDGDDSDDPDLKMLRR